MKKVMHKTNRESFCSAIGITLLAGLSLSVNTFADTTDVVDEINITVPVSCTMSGTGMASHNANLSNGTYQADIGTTTLKAFCNDNEGFAIYAAGYTGNEIGAANSNKLVGTSASGNGVIETGLATTAGNPDVSNWAMKLNTNINATYAITLDNGFGAYSAVPNSYTKVAHRDSGTDTGTSAVGAELTTTYAAYISKTQPADTYSGQVIYTLVHPSNADAPFVPHEIACEAGNICYHANADPVETEGTMSTQAFTKAKDWSSCKNTNYETYCSDSSYQRIDINTLPELDYYEFTPIAANFKREGYGFAGWSTTYDYSDPTGFYGPSETINIPEEDAGESLSLYAYWVKSSGTIQNWTCPNDATMPIGSITALTDERDNQTYAVAKLSDGKCWMVENLRLDNQYSTGNNKLLAQGYHSSYTGLPNAESYPFDYSITSSNSLYSIDGSTENTISGGSIGYRFPRYSKTTSIGYASPLSYGYYYTWAATIADTSNYSSNNTSVTSTSICPTGWHLPSGGSSDNSTNSEYWQLGTAIMSFIPANNSSFQESELNNNGLSAYQAFRTFPNNFILSGYRDDSYGYMNNEDTGCYWSSTTRSN